MGTNPFTNRKGNPRIFAPVERGSNLEDADGGYDALVE
jgi:hypothetical protein